MPVMNWTDWIHASATVIGAWGGFPKPPKLFLDLTKFEIFQWFLLAYQGGAGEDIRAAVIITVGLYLVSKILSLKELIDLQRALPTASEQSIEVDEIAPTPDKAVRVTVEDTRESFW